MYFDTKYFLYKNICNIVHLDTLYVVMHNNIYELQFRTEVVIKVIPERLKYMYILKSQWTVTHVYIVLVLF
jgi:hypothetical protein